MSNDPTWKIISDIPQQPQAQSSLDEQLNELAVAANRLGLYDANDWIMALLRLRAQNARNV